jgi:S1-C subfamily serine protease
MKLRIEMRHHKSDMKIYRRDKKMRWEKRQALKRLIPGGSLLTALVIFSLLILLFLPAQARSLAGEEASDILKKVAPSVVKVEVVDGVKKVATGVILDRDGFIMTTALISPRKEKITVKTQDGQTYEASFVGFDPLTRLALLQVKAKGLQAIPFAQTRDISPGDWVAVISISPEDTPAITQGIVSSVSEGRIRLNISVLPGASGSPVVNRKGEMIGLLRGPYTEGGPVLFEFREREVVGSGYVLSRGEVPASGLALAIPVDMVRKVAEELKAKGRVERGWLGVSLEEDSRGVVRITSVEKDSPAEQAGLREGDIIRKINGRDVRYGDFLAMEIRNRRPGEEVNLEIERNGRTKEVKVKLGAYPEEEARREMERWLPGVLRPWPVPQIERWRFWERRRFIGIYPEEIGPELAEYFGVKEGRGLLVTRLEPDSPAEKAGIKVGDVIVRADGRRVETIEELNSIIQRKKKGDKLKLDLVRDKKRMELEVEIAEEERGGSGFRDWNEIAQSFEKRIREFQEKIRQWQEQQALRTRENWRRIEEEMKNLRKDYELRFQEYEKKLKDFQEKAREIFPRKIIFC